MEEINPINNEDQLRLANAQLADEIAHKHNRSGMPELGEFYHAKARHILDIIKLTETASQRYTDYDLIYQANHKVSRPIFHSERKAYA